MQVAMGKKYRTRSGCEVEILRTDLKNTYPVLGIVKHPDGAKVITSRYAVRKLPANVRSQATDGLGVSVPPALTFGERK